MAKSVATFFNPHDHLTPCNESSGAIMVLGADGKQHVMDLAAVDQVLHWACADITDVNAELLITSSRRFLHNGMQSCDVGTALLMTTQPLIEIHPGYSTVSARLLLDSLWDEVRVRLGQQTAHGGDYRAAEYPALFRTSIRTSVALGLVSSDLLAYDLERLGRALCPDLDKALTFRKMQSLYDHCLLQFQGTRLELPQIYFMRRAMEMALAGDHPNTRAIELYSSKGKW